ncbi:phage tail-collar fiber domain-containing protein [Aeromonas caviae]|uniref:phage tail-collar fiber domain-containing protein n=1 Tax=Aeromonas caviae TaxID=648 RepID=UPI0038D056F4
MSQVITNAFEQYWQSSLATEQPVVLDEFILADIPNLDITAPIDPDTVLPPESQIVHRQNVDQRGRINSNAVAYSIVMDTTVGDFSFNAMFLRNKANGVIGMVVYKGRETKLKTDQTTGQTGNSLVKSMLMGYDQAAEATLTHVDAGTWQIDYAARLRGQDEDLRQLASQLYGHHTFIGDGFKVVQQDGGHQVTQGVAIVGGLRIELNQPQVIYPGTKPIGVWVDVHRSGSLLSEHQNHFTIITSVADLTDHVDSNGYQHYVAKLATVLADGTIEDGRGITRGDETSIPESLSLLEQADAMLAITSWEALRRSYAEVGYNLRPYPENFKNSGTLTGPTDVLLDDATGIAYSGPGPYPQEVPKDTNPSFGGFVARNLEMLRLMLASNGGAGKVGESSGATVQERFDFWFGKRILLAEKRFAGGAKGNGIADDIATINAAVSYAKSLPNGCRIYGTPGHIYRITSGIVIDKTNVVLDLDGAIIKADFSAGWAVSVGGGAATYMYGLGIRNGMVTTSRTETELNGVRFRNGVRRQVAHDKLHVTDFNGTGVFFEQMNWSIQGGHAPLIERCGVNLWIDDNGNAITIAGIGLDAATSYNARIRGAFSITFIGGYIQNAGLQGVLLEDSTTGSNQDTTAVMFAGTYFEHNGTNHIWGKSGRGLVVHGCYMNNSLLSAAAIRLSDWVGADIRMNTPVSTGAAGFVSLDTGNSLIAIGKQAVTSGADTVVTGDMSGVIEVPAFSNAIPTASPLNIGAIVPVMGSGTGANRTLPYMCLQIGSGNRVFTRLRLGPRKQGATAVTSPFIPNINSFDTFDITVPSTGLTISAPNGPFDDGDEIKFILKQSSVGGGAIAWDPVYKTALDNTGNGANAYASVTFTYSAGRSLWIQTGSMAWMV